MQLDYNILIRSFEVDGKTFFFYISTENNSRGSMCHNVISNYGKNRRYKSEMDFKKHTPGNTF